MLNQLLYQELGSIVPGIMAAHPVCHQKEIGQRTYRRLGYKDAVLVNFPGHPLIRPPNCLHQTTPSYLVSRKLFLSWPQAPLMSRPISLLIVTFIPFFSSTFLNAWIEV